MMLLKHLLVTAWVGVYALSAFAAGYVDLRNTVWNHGWLYRAGAFALGVIGLLVIVLEWRGC